MKCKNCQIELEQIEGKEGKVFCSDKCRKAYNRKLTSDKISVPTTDKPTSDNTEQPTSDTINRWGKNVKEMDAQALYAFIQAYPGDTWKDSPEFKELMKRLKTKPLKALRKEGYWIPSWKEPYRV